VRSLLLAGILARVPATAFGITLTLHVTNGMGRSWAQAGLVTAAYTIGSAVGQPLTGRLLDRRGLRTTMAATTVVAAGVWGVSPHLSYPALVVAAVVGGVFGPPIFSVVRLSLAAMVPVEQRRTAFALDAMIVELSYMVGPAVAVLLATNLRYGYGLYALAGGVAASGALMWSLNAPTHPEGHATPEVAPSRRTWFGRSLVALLIVAAAATFTLSSAELTVVATLRNAGVQQWTGVAIVLWCLYSLLGGLVFGAGRRHIPAIVLVGSMALLTIPIGLGSAWPWLLLALLPSGLLCAPAMTAANVDLARIVPAASRGEATGVLGSAFTVGVSLGAPFAGLIIDGWGTSWSFAAAGAAGLLVVLAAIPAYRRRPRTLVPDVLLDAQPRLTTAGPVLSASNVD
jgi:MFS family permease